MPRTSAKGWRWAGRRWTPARRPSASTASSRSRRRGRCRRERRRSRFGRRVHGRIPVPRWSASNRHGFARRSYEDVTDTARFSQYRPRRGRRDDAPPLGGGPEGRGPLERGLMGRFRDALAAPGLTAIAEVKRRSPSAGDLRPDADPAVLATSFERAGAAAVSILVDERFAGTLDDLRAARAAARLPLLAKGFFTLESELEELKAAGADAALLILRDLDDRRAAALMAHAHAIGLDTLMEAHNAQELDRAASLGADPIGVNARDLATFAIDRRAQLELVSRAPRDRIV